MAFDEDIPQMQMGPVHWLIAIVMLVFLGLVIQQQMNSFGQKARKSTCLDRQKIIQDCVGVWENDHGSFPKGTHGYVLMTRNKGTIFKNEGFPPEFTGDAISNCNSMRPWVCPEDLYRDFQGDRSKVPDDKGKEGFGNYGFAQSDKVGVDPPLKDFIGCTTPFRWAFCTAWGGKKQNGPDGRAGSRHSDNW